jgi:hypothetical protein
MLDEVEVWLDGCTLEKLLDVSEKNGDLLKKRFHLEVANGYLKFIEKKGERTRGVFR